MGKQRCEVAYQIRQTLSFCGFRHPLVFPLVVLAAGSIARAKDCGGLIMNKSFTAVCLFVLSFTAAGVSAKDCGGFIACVCGDTVRSDYIMTSNLGPCANGLGVDKAFLNCNGRSIIGLGQTGIGILFFDGQTMGAQNCRVRDFEYGVVFANFAGDILLWNNILSNNTYGIYINDKSEKNRIHDNTIKSGSYGIYYAGEHSLIYNNQVYDNADYGIYMDCAINNSLWNNSFWDNGVNAYQSNDSILIRWNSSTIGNFWGDFTLNFGYPFHYFVPGPGNGIDEQPSGTGTCSGVSLAEQPGYSDCVATPGRDWLEGYETMGLDSPPKAMAVYDDGTGPAVYVAGAFRASSGTAVSGVAKWNGCAWVPVGTGCDGDVRALAVFDNGHGQSLFAGGQFSTAGGVAVCGIARWDGLSWHDVGGGVSSAGEAGAINKFLIHDDGNGPALYAGGMFDVAGSVTATNVAVWDGTTWSTLGDSPPLIDVHTMAVFDDGDGPAIYAAGHGSHATDSAWADLYQYREATWTAIARFRRGEPGDWVEWTHHDVAVYDLAAFEDESGCWLYVASRCGAVVDPLSSEIFLSEPYLGPRLGTVRWNGNIWEQVGPCMHDTLTRLVPVVSGGASGLYAASLPQTVSSPPVSSSTLYEWNGSDWVTMSLSPWSGLANAIDVYDDGTDALLYVAGAFAIGATPDADLLKWNGTAWNMVTGGNSTGGLGLAASTIQSMAVHNDGTDTALYTCDSSAVSKVTPTGRTIVSSIEGGTILASLDLGSGPALYLDGDKQWDGSDWIVLGGGLGYRALAMAVFDAGSGPELYAAGRFLTPVKRIARWNGWAWNDVGGGISMGGEVRALATFDDGGGNALYAGGAFVKAGEITVSNIARWDGTSWGGVGNGTNCHINALCVHDDGSGSALYVGGTFTQAGEVETNGIARWNGSAWSALGTGLNGPVYALRVFNDGTGAALYAAGGFTSAGGVTANRMAKWDGISWSGLDNGTDGPVRAIAGLDEGCGPVLYAGGTFTYAGGKLSYNLAKWGNITVQINQQPVPQIVVVGQTAAFSVAATGSSSLKYQWYKDGVPITSCSHATGYTSATLTIEDLQWDDAGSYSVVVKDCGSDLASEAATLTVTVRTDFDGDGDVDKADFDLFENCASGPAVPCVPSCADKDLDGDGDVDSTDFAEFQRCFGGTGSPPSCR